MKNQKNNIVLVPSDFTEIADIALDHGIGVAKLLNYKLSILHIINKETKSQLKKEKSNQIELGKKLQAQADNIK
jgi:nucleotide-binding universal stress UspA family protein